MTHVILRVAACRWGVKKFQDEVNKWLEDGYTLEKVGDGIRIEKKLLTFICTAVVSKKG